MPASKGFSLTPQLRPEPRWQGMAVSLAVYAALFLVFGVLRRPAMQEEQRTATQEEVDAARQELQRRQVRMVYLPPPDRPRPAPAPTPPVPTQPPKSGGPDRQPDPTADPIRALRSPIADPGGDATRIGDGATEQQRRIAPPRPIPLALATGPSAPSPAEPSPSSTEAAEASTPGGINIGPRLGLTPRDPRPWTQSMPERGDSCPVISPDSLQPGEPRMGSASGRVLRTNGEPLSGAHLQVMGTSFVTFTDNQGEYTLRFDAALLDRCRTQYVRVSAPGFESRLLVLVIGRNVRSDDVALRRN